MGDIRDKKISTAEHVSGCHVLVDGKQKFPSYVAYVAYVIIIIIIISVMIIESCGQHVVMSLTTFESDMKHRDCTAVWPAFACIDFCATFRLPREPVSP